MFYESFQAPEKILNAQVEYSRAIVVNNAPIFELKQFDLLFNEYIPDFNYMTEDESRWIDSFLSVYGVSADHLVTSQVVVERGLETINWHIDSNDYKSFFRNIATYGQIFLLQTALQNNELNNLDIAKILCVLEMMQQSGSEKYKIRGLRATTLAYENHAASKPYFQEHRWSKLENFDPETFFLYFLGALEKRISYAKLIYWELIDRPDYVNYLYSNYLMKLRIDNVQELRADGWSLHDIMRDYVYRNNVLISELRNSVDEIVSIAMHYDPKLILQYFKECIVKAKNKPLALEGNLDRGFNEAATIGAIGVMAEILEFEHVKMLHPRELQAKKAPIFKA